MRTQINIPIKWKREVAKRDTALGSEQKYILRWAKKIKSVEYKGGKCYLCGENRIHVLVFHHRDSNKKENSIEEMICVQKRWSDLIVELDKCDLVCENCHREIHSVGVENNRKARNKKICLEFKQTFKCSTCGYSKCNWALEFHHTDDKTLGIAKYCNRHSWKSVGDLQKNIIEELNKCVVCCSNCHKEKHFDLEKFEKFRNEIYAKKNVLKEKNPPVDKGMVLLLLQEGKTVREVANILKCSYFRVYEISKEYGIRDNIHRVDKEYILRLWQQGKTRTQIILETGYSKSSVLKTIRKSLEKR